jgi:hypothetical protein
VKERATRLQDDLGTMRQQFEDLRRECSRLEASLAQSHPERQPAPVRPPEPVAPVAAPAPPRPAARPVAPTAATGPRRPPVIRFSAVMREDPEAP